MKLPALLLLVSLSAAFQSALSASLSPAEDDVAAQHDGLTELQKIDQMEFEAAQKEEATHKNATEDQREDGAHREDQTDAEGDSKVHRSGNSNAPEDSRSSEESGEMTLDSTKDQEGQCSTRGPSARVGNGHGDTGSHGDQQ